ncbi:MAG TPA: glycoside hydrolase family 2 TIM barrel-domain containing protein [Prolixibacteraceae bacterium]|nr:glycoside hydrolase family 2 TIM barrel-domain containing protein [Prolixibacteraceae bacterium]
MKPTLLFIALLMLSNVVFSIASNKQTFLKWELSYAKSAGENSSKRIPATVPGAVQLDIAKAEKYAPHYYAENWKDYLWMEDQHYTYTTDFSKPILAADERLIFVSKGIDYQFKISLNGEELLSQEGMFTPVSLDLTDKLKDKNELTVQIAPVPKLFAEPASRSQAAHVAKPAVSYGWDWHPRLVPLGIWDETYLEVQPASHIDDLHVDYALNNELTQAKINLRISGRNLENLPFVWTLKDETGKEVLKSEGKTAIIFNNPQLWWPHDHGKPYLYTSVVQLFDASGKVIQTSESRIGFRRVKLVMNEGAWREPDGFPKSRSVPPAQLEINGRKIFGKGTNWVHPEIFYGTLTRERYNELLDLAKEVNFNILRVWGGGIVNKESFFELCDEKGLLVWQEFPLACNNYRDEAHYLSVLKQEAASIIKRVRNHPSLALWSGGNELFNSWSGMTDQSIVLRMLNSQCLELDPNTPFIPTSPVMGMAHGNYVFRDLNTKEEVFSNMARAHYTAYTEFGMPAPASVEILKTIIPQEELWPPKAGTSWESHHAYNAWVGNTWLCQDIIEDYFGVSRTLEELVANGQLMQGEGYKCIYEEARRQKPYCAMAVNWCYNEPWPTAANNSLISYPSTPKPAYGAVKNACRPVLASAKLSKFKWTEGEIFFADAWMLNDLATEVPAGKVKIKLVSGNSEIALLNWDYEAMKANVNQAGPTVRVNLPAWKTDRFKLVLEVEDHPEYNSEYTLAYQPRTVERVRTTPVMNQ